MDSTILVIIICGSIIVVPVILLNFDLYVMPKISNYFEKNNTQNDLEQNLLNSS